MAKPTLDEVRTLLPAAAAARKEDLVERVDAAAGLLYLHAHGLSEGTSLELELVRGTTPGASSPRLPILLSEGTAYEAVPATDGAIRLRLPGGATIAAFGDAGVGRFRLKLDPWADLLAQIDRSYRYVISQCTGHGGDVTSGIVTDMAAAHAANAYASAKAAGDPAKEATYERALRVWREDYAPYLKRLFAGSPVKGAVDETPAVVENGAVLVTLQSSAPFDLADGSLRA